MRLKAGNYNPTLQSKIASERGHARRRSHIHSLDKFSNEFSISNLRFAIRSIARNLSHIGNEFEIPHRPQGRSRQRILWIYLLVLGVYAMSIGPAFKFLPGKYVTVAKAFYSPVLLLAQACKPCGQVLGWYVFGLWRVPTD